MEYVLVLNNAFYVDSIKDTWVKGAGHCTDTMSSLEMASQNSIPCMCKFGAVAKDSYR